MPLAGFESSCPNVSTFSKKYTKQNNKQTSSATEGLEMGWPQGMHEGGANPASAYKLYSVVIKNEHTSYH